MIIDSIIEFGLALSRSGIEAEEIYLRKKDWMRLYTAVTREIYPRLKFMHEGNLTPGAFKIGGFTFIMHPEDLENIKKGLKKYER